MLYHLQRAAARTFMAAFIQTLWPMVGKSAPAGNANIDIVSNNATISALALYYDLSPAVIPTFSGPALVGDAPTLHEHGFAHATDLVFVNGLTNLFLGIFSLTVIGTIISSLPPFATVKKIVISSVKVALEAALKTIVLSDDVQLGLHIFRLVNSWIPPFATMKELAASSLKFTLETVLDAIILSDDFLLLMHVVNILKTAGNTIASQLLDIAGYIAWNLFASRLPSLEDLREIYNIAVNGLCKINRFVYVFKGAFIGAAKVCFFPLFSDILFTHAPRPGNDPLRHPNIHCFLAFRHRG